MLRFLATNLQSITKFTAKKDRHRVLYTRVSSFIVNLKVLGFFRHRFLPHRIHNLSQTQRPLAERQNEVCLHIKDSSFLSDFNHNHFIMILVAIYNMKLHENLPGGTVLFRSDGHAEGRTEGQTDMTRLIAIFREYFAKATKWKPKASSCESGIRPLDLGHRSNSSFIQYSV